MRRAPNLQPPSRRRMAIVGAAIGLAVAGLLTLLRSTPALEGIEWRMIDARTRHFLGATSPDPRLVIASISDEDIGKMRASGYEWPWPLDLNSYAFRWMAHCGVAAVVVDVYQFDRGAGWGEWTAAHDLAKYEAEPLAEQYREVRRTTLAFELTSNRPRREPLRVDAAREKLRSLPPLPSRTDYVRPYAALPVVTLLRGAHSIGFANTETDGDGIARRALPLARVLHLDPGGSAAPERKGASPGPDAPASDDDIVVPSLPLAAAMNLGMPVRVTPDSIDVGEASQRLSSDATFYVSFRSKSDAYPRVSVSDLIGAGSALKDDPSYAGPPGLAGKDALRGKIVMWGINVAGIKDVVPTPVSDVFPGPEFQVTVLDNLLHGDGRVPISRTGNAGLLVAIAGLLGAAGGAWPRRGVFVGLSALAVALVLVGGYALFAAGTVVDLFTPLAGIVLTYAGVVAFRLMTEGRRNRWLETTFGQYLSPAVIEELKKDPSRLALGGRRTEVTVLFSDIKGFTSITEALKPRPGEFVKLMNVYLTGQSDPVLDEDGVIDKFIGDAVMAFFGDPLQIGDHALRACRAAIRSQEALAPIQPFVASLGLPPLVNRIGVNTGPAYLGNMGSEKRFSYTAMGDDVNLASRLEGANKAFGTHILVGPDTYAQAKDHIVAKPIARLRVVGKAEPVLVHELVALAGEADATTLRHVESYRLAHAAVLADDLDGAIGHLEAAEADAPGDGACAWLRSLVAELRRGDRPRPWDGVVVLESKG